MLEFFDYAKVFSKVLEVGNLSVTLILVLKQFSFGIFYF